MSNMSSVYLHNNVDRPNRLWKLAFLLADHQSEFALYFVRTLYHFLHNLTYGNVQANFVFLWTGL